MWVVTQTDDEDVEFQMTEHLTEREAEGFWEHTISQYRHAGWTVKEDGKQADVTSPGGRTVLIAWGRR